jgi:hypothetical protein
MKKKLFQKKSKKNHNIFFQNVKNVKRNFQNF